LWLLAAGADLSGVADVDAVQQLLRDPFRFGVDRFRGSLRQQLRQRADHTLRSPPQVIRVSAEITNPALKQHQLALEHREHAEPQPPLAFSGATKRLDRQPLEPLADLRERRVSAVQPLVHETAAGEPDPA